MKIYEALRFVASYAPLVGLVAKPETRPNGISAIVRVRGDEEWIGPSLLSIREFADEILVFDNEASPETQKTLKRLRHPLGDLLRLERCPQLDLFQLSNLGLAKARFRWVIRWDADFVAHTTGTRDIRTLRRHLLELDPRRYYLVYVPAVEVAGDLFHQFPDLRVRFDGQAAVWSHEIRYVGIQRTVAYSQLASPDRIFRTAGHVRRTLEALETPRYYRVLRWHEPAYFHVNVKSGRHMLLRHYWLEWLVDGSSQGSAKPREDYVALRVEQEWGISNLAEAERLYLAAYCERLVPFDADRCGPYPELLLPYLRQPRYRVEYRGGVIRGRRETA